MVVVNGVPSARHNHFDVDASESGLLIQARSTAGAISFGTNAIEGSVDVAEFDGALMLIPPPLADLSVDLRTLRSGNKLYDAELAQRLDVRRHPTASITLNGASMAGTRYQVTGLVTLHGATKEMSGSVTAERAEDGWLISGEQVFDIRDFDIPVPSVLMLRIFPDVRVFLTLMLRPSAA
jgi:hypothetical protein